MSPRTTKAARGAFPRATSVELDAPTIEARAAAAHVSVPDEPGRPLSHRQQTLQQIERSYENLGPEGRQRLRELHAGIGTNHRWEHYELTKKFGVLSAVVARVLREQEAEASVLPQRQQADPATFSCGCGASAGDRHYPGCKFRSGEPEASVRLDGETQAYQPEQAELERLNAATGFKTPAIEQQRIEAQREATREAVRTIDDAVADSGMHVTFKPDIDRLELEHDLPSAEALAEMPEVTPEQWAQRQPNRFAMSSWSTEQSHPADEPWQRSRVLSVLALTAAENRISELEQEVARLQPQVDLTDDPLVPSFTVQTETVAEPVPESGQYHYRAVALRYAITEQTIDVVADSFAEAMSKVADLNVVEIVSLQRTNYDYKTDQ